jgi:hypothetical protein
LTRVTVRMTHGSLYMTWPNDRLTRGSTDDSWTYTACDWAGECAVWMTCGMYGDDMAGMTVRHMARYDGDVSCTMVAW